MKIASILSKILILISHGVAILGLAQDIWKKDNHSFMVRNQKGWHDTRFLDVIAEHKKIEDTERQNFTSNVSQVEQKV